jgi:hypothetical protein
MHALVFRIRALGTVKDLTECYSLYNFSPHSSTCQAIIAHNEYERRCAHYCVYRQPQQNIHKLRDNTYAQN